MYIDMHCHLDMLEDAEKAIENAKKAGLKVIMNAGIDPKSNRKALDFSKQHKEIKAALGLYPIDALTRESAEEKIEKKEDKEDKELEIDIDSEIEFIRANKDKISAIGEVGLDYKNGRKGSGQEEQFRKFIELAIELDKPLIIHSRKAEEEVIEILEQYKYKKVIMHCFSGKKNLMDRAKNNDWYFTVPTNVVRSEQFQYMVRHVHLSRLFCETDSPFLSPYKDEANEPAFVVESYNKIAEIKGMDVEEVKRVMFMSYQKIF